MSVIKAFESGFTIEGVKTYTVKYAGQVVTSPFAELKTLLQAELAVNILESLPIFYDRPILSYARDVFISAKDYLIPDVEAAATIKTKSKLPLRPKAKPITAILHDGSTMQTFKVMDFDDSLSVILSTPEEVPTSWNSERTWLDDTFAIMINSTSEIILDKLKRYMAIYLASNMINRFHYTYDWANHVKGNPITDLDKAKAEYQTMLTWDYAYFQEIVQDAIKKGWLCYEYAC